MQQVTFTLRTITPLFLAGANQTEAELRAPTFRGLMRYWYRALVGGVVGANRTSIDTVMKDETAIFGANDTGSTVSVRVSDASSSPREFTERISINVNGQWQATGKGYLLWSMARSGTPAKNNVKPARWYFPPTTTFQVTLASRGSDDAVKLQQAIAAFWLLTHLGSVGSRSRRCAGSLTATLTKSDVAIPPDLRFTIPTTIEDLQKQLADGVRVAQSLTTKKAQSSEAALSLAPFDIISQGTCRIWIVQDKDRPWNSVEDAMKAIGEDLQDYRGSIKPIQRRRVFGLPLKDVDNKARRASPLLLRIAELQGNKYVCIAVLFKTAGKGISANDYQLVEEWATGFPGNVEVTL